MKMTGPDMLHQAKKWGNTLNQNAAKKINGNYAVFLSKPVNY